MKSLATRSVARAAAVLLIVAWWTIAAAPAAPNTLSEVREQIGASTFLDLGYDGGGVIIANVEGGHVFAEHEVLNGGKVQFDIEFQGLDPLVDQAHATQVGGVMVADGVLDDGSPTATGAGVAAGATLWSGRIATDVSGNRFSISGNSLLWPLMIAGEVGLNDSGVVGGQGAATADVMNSSWGFTDDTGNNVVHALYDYLANSEGVTMVVAAGNAGQGAGSVLGPANSWNVIAVGATGGTDENEDVTLFSSGGPTGSFGTAGTRIKPDIVAPGLQIQMPTIGGETSFATSSGTSFASPIVAACAALVIDLGKETGRSTDPRVVKSVLLNSAPKLAGWSQQLQSHPTSGTSIATAPLDASQGTGRVDLTEAYDQYTASGGVSGSMPGAVDAVGWSLDTVTSVQPRDYFIEETLAGGSTLTATLSWFMDRSVVGFDENSANPFAATSFYNDSFDDLDLYLFKADAGGQPIGDAIAASISGWDSAAPNDAGTGWDSVEHLYVTLPSDDRYLLRVVLAENRFDYPGTEHFDGEANSELFALAWDAVPVPEPSAFGLLAMGVLTFTVWTRRMRKTRRSSPSSPPRRRAWRASRCRG